MTSRTVTTNLRLDQESWLQAKTAAAELGLSFNEYSKYCLEIVNKYRELAVDYQQTINQAKDPIWRLSDITQSVKPSKKKLSDEDHIIYGDK